MYLMKCSNYVGMCTYKYSIFYVGLHNIVAGWFEFKTTTWGIDVLATEKTTRHSM